MTVTPLNSGFLLSNSINASFLAVNTEKYRFLNGKGNEDVIDY